MIDLTVIVEAVLTLCIAAVSAFVIPWLKRKVSAEKLAEVSEWVQIAVTAAEQIYNGPGRGAEKKAYVLKFLNDRGYTVDMDAIENLIEAAVYELPEKLTEYRTHSHGAKKITASWLFSLLTIHL